MYQTDPKHLSPIRLDLNYHHKQLSQQTNILTFCLPRDIPRSHQAHHLTSSHFLVHHIILTQNTWDIHSWSPPSMNAWLNCLVESGNYIWLPSKSNWGRHPFHIQTPNNKDPQIMVIDLILFLKTMRRKSTLFLANLPLKRS